MKDLVLAIATAPKRNSRHWKNGTTTWSEIKGWLDSPASKKEAGNYLLGTLRESTVIHTKGGDPCTGVHRRKHEVVTRSAIALDIDKPNADFVDAVEMLFDYAAIIHTTYSSSPDALRYRMIVPTDREMAPDEYITAAKALMRQFGEDQFDPGSSQPERYMFKPAAQEPGWFSSWVFEGSPVPVETLLADFVEDLSDKPMPKPSRTKRNPFEIGGTIGAFNRAYQDWDALIEAYDLPYEKYSDDRYHLAGATSVAGMGPVRGVEGFVYSHHANDPAYGKTCSAFDLVRLHRFGELDEDVNPQTPVNKLPSHEAMLDLASIDPLVLREMVGAEFSDEMEEEGAENSWRLDLRRTNRGKIVDTIQNWDLITANDPAFKRLYFNELTLMPEADGDLPWRTVDDGHRIITGSDKNEFWFYVERVYGIKAAKGLVEALVDTTAARRRRNPVQEYLRSLHWDGKSRIETALPGVKSTIYTRMVARKVLVAAAARALDPGCKWDHTLVLFGSEGLGKTLWIERMSKGWSSSLGPLGNKDTLLTMQMSWIVTADEGHSLRKADHDAQKEFLTRTHDVFRMPYDRETRRHPRHCVIWSTTNDEIFLRRQQGNRRFLVVRCQEEVDFDAMTEEYVDQVWAEAVRLYERGEPLYLDMDESLMAALERDQFVEEDSLLGQIQAYLEIPVPENWDDMTKGQRAEWRAGVDQGFEKKGTRLINQVCSAQIREEVLGLRGGGPHSRVELQEITEALKRLPGWTTGPHGWFKPYGTQRTYIRKGTEEE